MITHSHEPLHPCDDEMALPEVRRFSHALIPTRFGELNFCTYRHEDEGTETLVVIKGNLPVDEPVFVRIHSECLTSEVFGSLKCDCASQLEHALKSLEALPFGVIIYLRQEGRGIGLGNKIKAYHLQNNGLDTVTANHALGFPEDLRDFSTAAAILHDLGINRLILNTNNPDKIDALRAAGLDVCAVEPSLTTLNEHNRAYLQTKFSKLGHHLAPLFSERT